MGDGGRDCECDVGTLEGIPIEGCPEGGNVGCREGSAVGCMEGTTDGGIEGLTDGTMEGAQEGGLDVKISSLLFVA